MVKLQESRFLPQKSALDIHFKFTERLVQIQWLIKSIDPMLDVLRFEHLFYFKKSFVAIGKNSSTEGDFIFC